MKRLVTGNCSVLAQAYRDVGRLLPMSNDWELMAQDRDLLRSAVVLVRSSIYAGLSNERWELH